MKTLVIACGLLTACFGAASALVFTDDFENGRNTGGWTYFAPNEEIETTGGNPDAWLHAWQLDTFAPRPRTTLESNFTGDFRSRGVSAIGIDLITIAVDFSAAERPLTLMLYSDNGTPGDPDDDWAAYTLGPDIPEPGDGWQSYQFNVPSGETSLPAGWLTVPLGPDSPADPDWNDVITNVSALGFFYGDPTFVFIFQNWDVGMDNVSITYESAVPVETVSWGAVKNLYR